MYQNKKVSHIAALYDVLKSVTIKRVLVLYIELN